MRRPAAGWAPPLPPTATARCCSRSAPTRTATRCAVASCACARTAAATPASATAACCSPTPRTTRSSMRSRCRATPVSSPRGWCRAPTADGMCSRCARCRTAAAMSRSTATASCATRSTRHRTRRPRSPSRPAAAGRIRDARGQPRRVRAAARSGPHLHGRPGTVKCRQNPKPSAKMRSGSASFSTAPTSQPTPSAGRTWPRWSSG